MANLPTSTPTSAQQDEAPASPEAAAAPEEVPGSEENAAPLDENNNNASSAFPDEFLYPSLEATASPGNYTRVR
jgi:hypothetical protein